MFPILRILRNIKNQYFAFFTTDLYYFSPNFRFVHQNCPKELKSVLYFLFHLELSPYEEVSIYTKLGKQTLADWINKGPKDKHPHSVRRIMIKLLSGTVLFLWYYIFDNRSSLFFCNFLITRLQDNNHELIIKIRTIISHCSVRVASRSWSPSFGH